MQEIVDMIIIKVRSITNHFFMKGKQNISSLHKTICSLVSLFFMIYYESCDSLQSFFSV